MGWTLAIVAALVLAGYAGARYAIARNGPAVLDAVDRIAGGTRGTERLATHRYGPSPAQKLAVYGPADAAEPRPVIVFSHGGSWRSGDPDDYGFVARTFVPEGFVVVLAGYRLHPESAFPGMLEDTASVVAWTEANIAQYGGDPQAIFLAGHSAGAYNAVMTAIDPQWLAREGLGADTVAGAIGLAGPYDFYPFDSESTRASFGEASDPANTTQPVAFASAQSPPMLLLTGERDTTVKPRNSRALAAKLKAAGVPVDLRLYPDMDHYDILVKSARPWADRRVVDAVREFALPIAQARRTAATASVPVQAKIR